MKDLKYNELFKFWKSSKTDLIFLPFSARNKWSKCDHCWTSVEYLNGKKYYTPRVLKMETKIQSHIIIFYCITYRFLRTTLLLRVQFGKLRCLSFWLRCKVRLRSRTWALALGTSCHCEGLLPVQSTHSSSPYLSPAIFTNPPPPSQLKTIKGKAIKGHIHY